MMQSLSREMSSMRFEFADHMPLFFLSGTLLVYYSTRHIATDSASGETTERWTNDAFFVVVLIMAYFIGFAGEKGKQKKSGASVAKKGFQGKAGAYEGGRVPKRAPQAAGGQWPKLSQGAGPLAAPRSRPVGTEAAEEGEDGPTKVLSMQKASQQLESDTQILKQAQQEGIEATTSSYARVMAACNRCNHVDMALKLFTQMLEKGVSSDCHTINICVRSRYFKLVAENLEDQRLRDSGIRLMEMIQEHGLVPSHLVQNRLICAWRSKLPDEVVAVFGKMKENGISLSATAYRCLMATYERTDPERTLKIYDEMVEKNIKLDRVAINAAMCACSHLGQTDQALQLFAQMPQHQLAPNSKTYGTLIRACTASHKAKEALDLFNQMREERFEPNRFAYHDAIQCCVKLNQPDHLEQAIQLYKDMKASKVPPCDNTYWHLIKTCQKRGWTEMADEISKDSARAKKIDFSQARRSMEGEEATADAE